MLRRSLILFLVFVLVGLGLTSLYALLGLRGTDDALSEARQALLRGSLVETVELLDRCEPVSAMQSDPQALQELWRLRLEANRRLDNTRRSLRDIENLVASGVDDEDLLLDRIYYLARLGDGQNARRHALNFLERHPDSARGHELAGEAIQVCYEPEVAELLTELRNALSQKHEADATAAMFACLYRKDGDAGGEAALRVLEELYAGDPRQQRSWAQVRDWLADVRREVQLALHHYQRALELAGVGRKGQRHYFAAAFRGVSFAMQQAARTDDLALQSELYLSGFDHRYTIEAAIAAAQADYRDGLDAAVVAQSRRQLPPGTLVRRLEKGRLDGSVEPLLVVEALALWRQRDAAALEQRRVEMNELSIAGLELALPLMLFNTFSGLLHDDRRTAELASEIAIRIVAQRPAPRLGTALLPVAEDDLLPILVPIHVDLLRARRASAEDLIAVATKWSKARPGTTAPLMLRGNLQLLLGQRAAALATAGEVLELAGQHEGALVLLAGAAELLYRETSRDGDSLVTQCLQRSQLRPDVPHPVCYLLCGEAALRQRYFDIARECAIAAADSYPWSRWPRHLEARVAQAAGSDTAVSLLENAIRSDAEDRIAIDMWFDAVLAAGERPTRHLGRAIALGPADAARATALLEAAVREDSPFALPLARRAVEHPDADTALLALAAEAFAKAGDPSRADELLQRARAVFDESAAPVRVARQRHALAAAGLARIRALASRLPDDPLLEASEVDLALVGKHGARGATDLLELARELFEQKRPKTAYRLASTALTMRDAGEIRDAASFALAGRLALATGQTGLAEAHLTAALGFPGGERVAAPLARLLLLRGEPERAAEVLAVTATELDPTLTLCCGDRELAFHRAQQRILVDGSDLLAQITFALLTQVGPDAIGTELAALEREQRRELAELVAILGEPELAEAVLPRLEDLLEDLPDALAVRLLHARALVDARRGERAAEVHERAFAAGCRELPLLTEAVRATRSPGYALPKPIRDHLLDTLATAPDSLTTEITVFTLRAVVADAAAAGNLAVASKVLADLWLRYPTQSRATVSDCASLLEQGRTADGIRLLDHLRQQGPESQRAAASRAMFVAGFAHGQGPAMEARLRTECERELDGGTAVGAALAFLFADPRRAVDVRDARLAKAFETLIDRSARGLDDWTFVDRVLQPVRQRLGNDTVLAIVERQLQRHPAALPLWLERARSNRDPLRMRDVFDEARNALDYADTPQLHLELALMSVARRELAPADAALAARLPTSLAESPRGRLLDGLVALRQGRAADAVPGLEAGDQGFGGLREFALALAELMRGGDGARARATRWLRELAALPDGTGRARYVDSYLLQLGADQAR